MRSFAEPLRARIAVLLLQAVKRRLQVDAMVEVPAFRVVDEQGPRLGTLLELRSACQRSPSGTKTLLAIYPGQRRDRFSLGASVVLVADATERSRLSEVMNLRFRPPDRREGSSSLGRTMVRGVLKLGRVLAWCGTRIRHPVRARPLEEQALSPQERVFLTRVREQLGQGPPRELVGATLCLGAGPVRRAGGGLGELLLPRDNPTVRAAVAAVNRDAAWVYPATLALFEGKSMPPSRARSRWLARKG